MTDKKYPLTLFFSYNAGYVHPAMGLRYLMANLADAPTRPKLLEVTRRTPRAQVLTSVLSHQPAVLAISVSIWNHLDTLAILPTIRRLLPRTTIVVGGPEATHLPVTAELFRHVDGIVRGEADLVFSRLLGELVGGGPGTVPSGARRDGEGPWLLDPEPPDPAQIELPHGTFSSHDAETRFMYLEASRGCPFRCEFCLSSLSKGVRLVPLDRLFDSARHLLSLGARQFKFIDRTFNLDYDRAAGILEFWLEQVHRGISVQFETVPDRFPGPLRDIIERFPDGTLRLEVGVQTYNPGVAAGISRLQDFDRTDATMRFLSSRTRATVHADLIVGLPGEDLESFRAGFDRLYEHRPAEIQVGVLKRLPGAPISRHDRTGQMRYSRTPPYEVLSTQTMDADTIDRLKRFGRFWELVVNKGRMPEAVDRLLGGAASPFDCFLSFSDFAFSRFGRDWGLAPEALRGAVAEFAEGGLGQAGEVVGARPRPLESSSVGLGRQGRRHGAGASRDGDNQNTSKPSPTKMKGAPNERG